MLRKTLLNFFLSFCVAFGGGSVQAADLADEALAALKSELDSVRLTADDLRLPSGWDLPLTIPAIERFFNTPLALPTTTSAWLNQLEGIDTLTATIDLSGEILGLRATAALPLPISRRESQRQFNNLPAPLRDALPDLIRGIEAAQPFLNKAVNSLAATDRNDFLELNEWPNERTGAIKQEISAQRLLRHYTALKKFNDTALLDAAAMVFGSLDRAMPLLMSTWDGPSRMRFETRIGTVLVSGTADDIYTEQDLSGVALLIDAGGHNTYQGRPAFAREKQIRIVVDLGSDVRISAAANNAGGAGTGAFGIGAFIAPNPHGVKIIETGSFSQGAGVAGVGVLWLGGPATLKAERFVQGAATCGIGLLRVDAAPKSTYVASRSGQGYASTRGVGLFLHRGDHSDIKGGLVQPDPREPSGAVSLCQGVGAGPRAYSGGGVGLAAVVGSNTRVEGSYFSQGCGYWHGLGGFRLRGDNSTLKARRYDMGTGVHSAFGHFEALGDHNRILNWGVGPSYGWDHAAGSSFIVGDQNEIQVDWGAGTASIGSLSFSFFKLTNSKLKLCDYGTNNFVRDEPAYSIQWLKGAGNQMQCQGEANTKNEPLRRFQSPWGFFHMEGTSLTSDLGLTPAEWPELPQEQAIKIESADLQKSIQSALTKPAQQQVGELVDVSSAFSLDKKSPLEARTQLIQLPADKAPTLIDALEPAAIDQLIQLSVLIPAYGDILTRDILKRLDRFPVQKKAVLINFLRMSRPSLVVDEALNRLSKAKKNEILKPGLIRILATFLNQDVGDEPGVRATLNSLQKTFSRPDDPAQRKETAALLSRLPLGTGFGLLNTVIDLNGEERMEFFKTAPLDMTSTLQSAGAESFLKLAFDHETQTRERVQSELNFLQSREPKIRAATQQLLTSTRAAVVAGALIALGQIANADDAKIIASYLKHPRAQVREAAAVSLARIGVGAKKVLEETLDQGDPQTRAVLIAGLSQTTSPELLPLLEHAWKDTNTEIQLTTLAVLGRLPAPLEEQRVLLIKKAKTDLKGSSNREIQVALQLLK